MSSSATPPGDIEMRRQPWNHLSSSMSGPRRQQRSFWEKVTNCACSRICCIVGLAATAVVAFEAYYLVNEVVDAANGGFDAIRELSERIAGLEEAILLVAAVAEEGIAAAANITIPDIPLEELQQLLATATMVLNPDLPDGDEVQLPDMPDAPDLPG